MNDMRGTARLRRIVAEILEGNSDTAAETLLERVRERAPELHLMLPEFERDVLMEASGYFALQANATVWAAQWANPEYRREVPFPELEIREPGQPEEPFSPNTQRTPQ